MSNLPSNSKKIGKYHFHFVQVKQGKDLYVLFHTEYNDCVFSFAYCKSTGEIFYNMTSEDLVNRLKKICPDIKIENTPDNTYLVPAINNREIISEMNINCYFSYEEFVAFKETLTDEEIKKLDKLSDKLIFEELI